MNITRNAMIAEFVSNDRSPLVRPSITPIGRCTDIEVQIAQLEQNLFALQRILDDEPDLGISERQRLLRRISDTQRAITAANKELLDCISDLTIVGVELTQGIQYFLINGQGSGYAPNNSVPLIAQRTLILRVYVNSKQAEEQGNRFPTFISGRVTVERIGAVPVRDVAILRPINGPIRTRSATSIDRLEADHTLNFRLSAADCQGMLRFNVEVFEQAPVVASNANPPNSTSTEYPGPARAPNVALIALCERVPTFRIRALLIHYTGHGMDVPAPTGLDFARTCEFMIRTYPIGRIEFTGCTEVEFAGDLAAPSSGCGPGWEGLLQLLRDARDGSDDNDIYVALVPQGAFSPGTAGCGNTGVAAAFAGSGGVLAQEVGHAFHRKHAPSGGAGGPDPDYPTYDNYPSGSIGEFGFDCFTSRVYDPGRTYDFMGYDQPRWISPYTYVALRSAMVERFGAAAAAASREEPVRPETLHLRFRLYRDRTIEVRPSFHLPTYLQRVDRAPVADISCELVDSNGAVLEFHRCHEGQPHQDPDGPYVDFAESLRWFDEATSIRFLQGKEVLHVHQIEDVAPDVAVEKAKLVYDQAPVRLQWKARHRQRAADEMIYMVRHSSDGGRTWRVVASGMRRPSVSIDPRSLPAGEKCCLQIVTSSGIRTTVTQGEFFAARPSPRSAYVLSPDPMAEFPTGSPVVLRGGSISPDSGIGDMTDVIWTSSLDGMIGRGFELVADGLSDGTHVITLTTPDGIGGAATQSVSIHIGPFQS